MKYKFVIHEPLKSHNVYEVPEAESFEEAVELIKNDMQDQYLTEFNVHYETGDYILAKRIPLAETLSLQQFMASRSFVPQHDSGMDIKVAALVYAGNLYIELTPGGYLLTLGNQQYMKAFTDVRGLLQLEELLYRWAVSERIFSETP